MDAQTLLYLIPAAGVVGLGYAYMTASWIGKQDPGDRRMQTIAEQIFQGAMAFIGAEYRVVAVFVVAVAALLVLLHQSSGGSPLIGLAFVVGASCSAAAGYFGMRVATKANVRTASAARGGLAPALVIAFRGGAVMGMGVVGLGLLGLGTLFVLFSGHFAALSGIEGGAHDKTELYRVVQLMAGYAMGASSIALFARVGGGIYTNNVGDVAGMGADLFESYVAAIVGAMIIGVTAQQGRLEAVMLPMVLAAVGIVVSVAATYAVRTREGGAAIVMLVLAYFPIDVVVGMAKGAGHPIMFDGVAKSALDLFIPVAVGLAAGVAIGFITGYYRSKHEPGIRSTAAPVLCIAAAIFAASSFAGVYGIALAGLGMLSTTGIRLAIGAYGPISANDTTPAIGRGFAIGAAAFAALALFAGYQEIALRDKPMTLTDPHVTIGLLIGGTLPFLFSALVRKAIARSVAIATRAALQRMVAPGMLALVTPVVMGFWSPAALAGLLAGTLISGVTLALFMSNAVGDPFKGAAAPSLNILIKLMSIVAVVIAPFLA